MTEYEQSISEKFDKIIEALKSININVTNDLKVENNETCKLINICKYKI
jgi:hypothetical protein